jgi:hypothetical protein
MYFTMVDHTEDGKTYSRRSGAMTPSFNVARARAAKKRGYILNEQGHMVGQAFDASLPKYIGSISNIGSGEDCYA